MNFDELNLAPAILKAVHEAGYETPTPIQAQAIPAVLPVLNYGGIVTFIGIDYGGRSALTLDANDFHFKKLQLRASHAAPALYFPAVLRLLADGAVDGSAIVSHVMPLERIADAMCLARDNRAEVLKVVIKP